MMKKKRGTEDNGNDKTDFLTYNNFSFSGQVFPRFKNKVGHT
jgi:hypothetical protein